ncbi:hypothetical protein [Thalassotalea ganghwensis]
MLINRITLLANVCFPFRRLLVLTCLFSLATIVYLLLFADIATQEQFLHSALLWFIWLFLAALIVYGFSGQALTAPQKGWWKQFKYKLGLFFRFLLMLIFILLSLATCYFTFKVLTIY